MSLESSVMSTKMKKIDEEDVVRFLGQECYEERSRQRSCKEASLDTELLQELVHLNEFTSSSTELSRSEGNSPTTINDINDIKGIESRLSQLPKIKEAHVKKTLKGLRDYSSELYVRMKNGIYSHWRKGNPIRSEEKDNDTDYDSSSSATPAHSSQTQLLLQYTQVQSAILSYSTDSSENTVVRNLYPPPSYAYPTVESGQLENQVSTINVLKLINIR